MLTTGRNGLFRRFQDLLVIGDETGPRIYLRGLDRRDGRRHAQHLQRLSAGDRRLRFHGSMSDQALTIYTREVDWQNALAFGVFVNGTLRGVAELMLAEDSSEGEISVSVEQDFQRAGLGRILVAAVIVVARKLSLTHLRMMYVRENSQMRALAKAIGAKSSFMDGVTEAVLTLGVGSGHSPDKLPDGNPPLQAA